MSLEKSNHSNTINKIEVVLLPTPISVPNYAHLKRLFRLFSNLINKKEKSFD